MSAVPDDYEIGLEEHERRIEGEQAALARQDRKAERADRDARCIVCGDPTGWRCCAYGRDVR